MNKFNTEYEYLVHLIKCALQNEQPNEKPEEIEFQKVFEHAKAHEVANIAFVSVQRLKQKPNDELYTKWKTIYAFSVQRHMNQMRARDIIVEALNSAAIRNLEAQGTIMKTLYPKPEWRMMSDIDFIIDKENLESAEIVMKELGYSTKWLKDFEVDAYGKNGIAVEVHSDFFAPNSIYYRSITDAFSTADKVGDTFSYEANQTTFYLYNLLHCIKHYLSSGAGIRRIVDMYIMREKMSNKVDLQHIDNVLSEYGFKTAAEEIFSIVDKWFCDEAIDKNIAEIEEKIYISNNHGTRQVFYRNQYNKCDNKGKRFFKLHKIITLLFPQKRKIYIMYPICEKYKLPVVFCWVYRWLVIILDLKKIKRALQILTDVKKVKLK